METGELQCQVENPFTLKGAMINTVFYFMPEVIGVYAIAKYKPRKLPLFIAVNVGLNTVMRRFVCARCQYYGQPCMTMHGIMTAKMMSRNESKPLEGNAIVRDTVILISLGLYTAPQILKSYKLAALCLASLIAYTYIFLFSGCRKCGNDFCPFNQKR